MVGSILASVFLVLSVLRGADPAAVLASLVYGIGLVAMLWSSAAYHLTCHPRLKEWFRRCDHAAIFLMIAGTYTPFAIAGLGGAIGWTLLSFVWIVAVFGMALKLLRPRRRDRWSVALYLALGWAGLPVAGRLWEALPGEVFALLGAGGVLYTVGVAFYLWERLPGHNAIWHGFVLAAAVCHYLAVMQVLIPETA